MRQLTNLQRVFKGTCNLSKGGKMNAIQSDLFEYTGGRFLYDRNQPSTVNTGYIENNANHIFVI